ncbi:hypothetical protein CSUNSWCD_537 [Campylobacter showae CSUNSWCD]|uniref:Uncharacterized protein n=1 Tax=Campylobacter showae CSUNSWCD TaxID=1244083 RepID=M5IPN8_9BACT|nr:hypothetical protein CSUNSWCD_537 [Campylobacter showae CSUNSWCD]
MSKKCNHFLNFLFLQTCDFYISSSLLLYKFKLSLLTL